MSSTGFETIADWWDSAVGEVGDSFHRTFSRPALDGVLGDVAGRRVLDLGCGNGASTRPLARRGAWVVGADVSPTLIRHARAYERKEPLGALYVVGDAAALPFPDAGFDRVVADMVLMDLEDGEAALREVGRVLRPGGRFVTTLFHPCFQITGGSSWLIEDTDTETSISRRVWRYLEPFAEPGVTKSGQPQPHLYYHRPLGWYAAQLQAGGMLIDTLDEPVPGDDFQREHPDLHRRAARVPLLLVLGAVKVDIIS